MLGNKNKQKKTVFGGIGVALLLCALMVLMPMSGYVDNNETAATVESVETDTSGAEDYFALPEKLAEAEYEYDPSLELQGMRDAKTKAFLNEDGSITQMVASEPVHYMSADGTWEDIDLNIQAYPEGWGVTENTFTTYFAPEVANGISVQANEFVDPVISGINPMLVTLDVTGSAPEPFIAPPSPNGVEVGGNVIRYPLAEGFDLDYSVESNEVKQNLILREAPVIPDAAEYFGLSEGMRMPVGYALFSGETMLGEELFKTQEDLQIRHIETGELLAEIPAPMIMEAGAEEPYMGTFFVQVYGPEIILITVVESDWLLDEDRVYPVAIDPSIRVNSNAGGYCYIYYAYCYSSAYRYHYRYYGSYYYIPWHKYTFSSSSALPSGATVDKIEWKKYMNYASGSTRTFQVKVLEACGLAPRYSYSFGSSSCSGSSISGSYLTSNYGGTASRSLKASIGRSPSAATVSSSGTGWKTVNLCNSATACAASSGGVSIITNALNNQGTVGIGEHYTGGNAYFYTYAYASGSRNSHLLVTYSGGTDADAPTSDFVPYTGIDSYIEGERTLFIKLTDMSGIDTTSSGAPVLYYSTDGGSSWSTTTYGLGSNNQFDAGELVSIGTCSSTATDCRFKARVDDLSYGDDFQYYWKFQDLNQGSNGANVGYEPALTGTQTTPTPYQVDIVDPANAPTSHKKMTVLTTDVHAGSYYTPQGFMDRQLTYYSHSDEYFFEFDTSNCGTGSQSCFYTGTSTFYGNWLARGNTAPAYGYYGMNSGSNKFNQNLWNNNGNGYLQVGAKDGPGMNIIFVYNSQLNKWATVGVDTETGIDTPLTGGSSATASVSYGYSQAYKFAIPGDITGSFGTFSFNATQTSTTANRLCVTTNGWYYFYRSISTDRCTSAYYMIYGSTSSYRWSGFALGSGYYGRQASTGDITYKVGNVAPTPDTFKPEMLHTPMQDSHAKSRTVSVKILDAGDPAAGLNVSSSAGVGPTLYHRITPDGGSAGSWVSTAMSQESGKTRAQCELAACTWSASVEDLEVNDTVEYYFSSRDVSTVSAGINVNTSSTYSFERGDPNKVFVVEWRDMSFSTYNQLCTVQALFYDVTNEIEYKYDSNCRTTYNSWSIGYMDQTRQKGASIAHSSSTSFNTNPGHVPTTSNFRITTSSNSHAWESFDKGLVEVTNANTAMSGTSSGSPYIYYCISSYYWNTYKARCNANIDIPADFEFEYFGTTYDGDDSNDRIQLSRQGSMYFISNGNTNVERNLWTYHQPALPYSGSSLARPGTLAPFWTGYNQYYCHVTSSMDCSVYYRVMPYEGKGTDVTADITSDPVWDLTDSPIRINPSNDYLVVSSDLTIKPGVQIFVAPGKGISFDGACTKMTALANETHPINITGLNGGEWKGMAFTDDCTSAGGTDDRHQFSHVNFMNTSDAVFRSGSRHDNSGPSCGSSTADCNTGNYTMSDVTFTNVGAVFTHGSGQGTVLTMEDFTIDGVDEACFNFPENTVATLKEGTIKDCNTDGKSWGGTIVNYPGSTAGALHAENLTVENSYVNFIDVDLQHVTVSNVSVTNPSAQTGVAIDAMFGTGSDVYLNNVDVDSYANSGINAMGSIVMTDVDLGTADLWLIPGGWSQTGNGPSSSDAVFDTITAGDITMQRIHPGTFTDITADDISLSGSSIVTETVDMANFDIDSFTVAGCGWNMIMTSPSLESFKSTCSSSSAKNSISIADADFAHGSSSDHVIDGRNSHITVGESTITSSSISSGTTEVAKARTGTNVVLVDVDLNGNECSDSSGDTGNCAYDVSSSSSNPSMVYFGGLANVSVYRLAQSVKVYKQDHVVTASLVDSSMNELFQVGSHITDANGNTSVWVIVEDSDGTAYEDHIVRAFGTAGQNETYPDNYPDTTLASSWYPTNGYTWGTHLDLLLEPAPVVFNDPTLDCYKLITDPFYTGQSMSSGGYDLRGNFDSNTNTFTFDDTSLTVSADLTLDTCGIELQGGSLRVQSTATSSPVITIKDTGFLTANNDGTSGNPAAIRAVSSTYGLHLDIQNGGTLTLDHANLRDVAWDATTESALYIGNGATLNMMDSATIYGSSASADEMATVKIQGGSANIDSSSIINTGQTGTAIWIENSGASLTDIIVKNAAVGIQSYNGAPQVDGFTSNGNTVGIDTYGGMSLPTIYRSTSLSGATTGWTTYKIDLSTYLGTGDYMQVGANSIWAGGNAHPSYNYATSKYYFITDRMNIMFEDDAGNAWNITDSGQEGYYPYSNNDPAVTAGTHTYNGGSGGAPSWHCNYYSAESPGNNYGSFDGYFYYMYRYWLGQTSVGYPDYYEAPDEFGFDWEQTEFSPTGNYQARYPYKYWGYYSPSFYFNGVYAPPEGANGQPSSGPGQPGNVGNPPSYASGGYPNNYGICLDYAYTYYMNSGQGARMTFPVVDISGATANGGNISKVYLWMDVLHRGSDNYQDRYDFVARSGNDPSDLGNYLRESGTPLFKEGTITGADTGIEVGGAFAAGHFEDIDIVGPSQAGLEIVGQTAATANRVNVSSGNYGVLVSNTASGQMDLENLDLENQAVAGVFYQSDLGGALSGTITGSTGAAFKYASRTSANVEFNNMNIANNAVGIETDGSGAFTLTDVVMSNTKDVLITGSATMEFIEGSIDTTTVEVTGTGSFDRLRQLDITLQANVSGTAEDVVGTNVVLKDADGIVTGMVATDSNGVANDLTFITQTVDSGTCASICTANLNGYEVVASATIDYYWSGSSNNAADFRYVFETMSLTDAAGNSDTVYLEDEFTARICYTSTAYVKQDRCASGLSSSGSRTFSNGLVEYGYLRSHSGNDLAGETVMMDAPFMYLASGKHNWNGSTWISTASYDFDGSNRMYPYYSGETSLYMHDASVTAVAVSSSGTPQGFVLGYNYYSMNIDMDNTTISGLATIYGAMGYGYYNSYELDFFKITNNTFTHFAGYTKLNGAIAWNDECMRILGGDGNIISGNTFKDCGVGMIMERSPYYYSHQSSEIGADNITITDNVFVDGGEMADIWFYFNNEAQGVEISGNEFSTSGHAIDVESGKTRNLLIQDNTITGGDDAIVLNNVDDFTVDNNDITGIQDATSTGLFVSGGYGNITDNTLTDADGGMYLDGMGAPPAPSNSLCSIGSSDYRRSTSCSWTLGTGKTAVVNLETDSWGYEISIEITKPDGTKDTWPTYSFSSNAAYSPLRAYTDAGNYTLDVADSWGDGGATISVVESSGATGNYAGPIVSGNTIGLSAGRSSFNAVGITATSCDAVAIQSASNIINLADNAIEIDDCDFSDVGSTLTGDGLASTVGIVGDDTNTVLTLNGTDVSGYATGVSKENGDLFMIGGAYLAGSDYGVFVEDTYVVAIDAHVDGGSTGTGLHVESSPDVWVYPMDASGAIGMYVEDTPFRWDGGEADATTALSVVDATGSVENMSWANAGIQVNAGNNAHITSIGNTLDSSKIVVASSAVIDEANLMSIDSTHLGVAPTAEVALLLTSTDNERASYVSTSFQPEAISVDGSDEDWNGGNALNPSGYAMPGVMSGDGTDDFLVTYIEGDGIYFGMTNSDLSNSDVLIYLNTGSGGSDVGYNGLGGAHNLPFSANYVLWADSEGSYDLYSYGFLGWSPSSLSTANVDVDFSTSLAEFGVPWSRIGGMPSEIDIVAIVQEETTADVTIAHPTQTLDSSATLQNLSKFMTVELTHGDLADGTLTSEVLVYQSYKGSTTATGQKNYDLMIKTPAACAYDWATVEDISLATNVVFDDNYVAGTGDTTNVQSTIDIKRACPVIDTEGADTDDGLVDFSKDEDSGAFTFSLTNLADDVQDEESSLTWTMAEGTQVAFNNDDLMDAVLNGQDVTFTPRTDQFGTQVFSFEVTDSNGLSDTHNITFTVNNINDAPVICNVERSDCMPIFSEDDGNYNILPEGFGTHTKFLGDVSNATRSYIRDMANEQAPTRQVYTWSASAVDFGTSDACSAFDVDILNNELAITENTNNELGGKCTVSLGLADDGAENQDATTFDVVFSVAPVNDAPVIKDWNRTTDTVMVADNGSIPALPWSISLMEDDENVANLTYDLSAIKADVDHELDDLTWTVESTDQCVYTNYFTTTIVGDDLVFDLIEDATTNANDW
ncbi:MAG: Ig-like domain-containing protein, partial [Poseidonia sp.]